MTTKHTTNGDIAIMAGLLIGTVTGYLPAGILFLAAWVIGKAASAVYRVF